MSKVHYRIRTLNDLFYVLLATSAVSVGCSDDSQMQVYPVAGQVIYKGQPAEGAVVVFRGVGETLTSKNAPLPKAECDEEGNFSLTSFTLGDGAPKGSYKVAIVWPSLVAGSEDMDPEEAERLSFDRLDGKYSDPRKPVFEAEVVPGRNSLEPFVIE